MPSRRAAISSVHAMSREWLVAIRCSWRVLDPLDRAAGAAARDRHQVVFRVELAAHPESAADIERDQLDRRLGQSEGGGERALVEMGDLGRPPELEGSSAGEIGDQPAGLQRQRGLAVGAEALAAPVGRGGEGGAGIAAPDGVADGDVAARLLVHQRRRIRRARRIGHRGEGLVVDFDPGQRVLGGVAVGGDHDGDRLAGEARLGRGDRGLQEAVEPGEPRRGGRGSAAAGGRDRRPRTRRSPRARNGRRRARRSGFGHGRRGFSGSPYGRSRGARNRRRSSPRRAAAGGPRAASAGAR